jgi:hypothetical protein
MRLTRRSVALSVLALATTVGLSAVVAPAGAAALRSQTTLRGQKITFGATTCAPHWYAPNPGVAHFAVHNESSRGATVLLFDAVTNNVIAQIPDLPAHSAAELTATVRAGRSYLWGCDLNGGVRHTSEPERVPGDPTHGGPGRYVPPIQVSQVRPALRKYRAYVHKQVAALVPDVQQLHEQLMLGNKAGAESAWLTAHLVWLQIGQDDGAYGIYGDLGRSIDGTAAGYQRGVNDPHFTGFHRIEHDLWAKGDIATSTADAKTLVGLVQRLSKVSLTRAIPGNVTGASNFILRAHEVIEDAVRDTLSGDDEYGSGTALASITADVSACREVLGLLAPLLAPRSPGLVATARRDLTRLDSEAAAGFHQGHWTAIAKLARSPRENIDAAAGAADEELAPVPDLLRIGNT